MNLGSSLSKAEFQEKAQLADFELQLCLYDFYNASQIAAIPWPPPIQTAEAPYFLFLLLNS